MSPEPIVRIESLAFAHASEAGGAGFRLDVERLALARGEHVACIGASGTGKTTLIDLISGLARPNSGRVEVAGLDLVQADEASRRALRITRIGMVFQEFALLEYASALENVLLPYTLSPFLERTAEVEERARHLAGRLGIEHLLRRRPARLSQGERQRVALCRALVTRPALLLCDEATGNLDPDTAGRAVDLLLEEARAHEAAVFLVTHDHSLLSRFDRVVDMAEFTRPGALASEAAP